ncbi:peptidoglycan binding domain-containing protein [Colletotrichum asianum]|uniref:T6SS Phospholipase effector Tle1-like catalytic domain-containing protein n=1 Tax=Colletotrichum asianum TaxID=702518 RepID=A0A8H3W022_9PEZI|nr:hypothetical protein GQ607_015720 [Colletotrichum asianum]
MGIFGKLVRDWRSLRKNQADSKSGHDADKTVDADQVATDPVDAAKRKGVIHKRIILCCDGTWQTSATIRKNVPSNVTRLARSIAQTGKMNRNGGSNTSDDETCQQIVYYSAGIGTGDGVNIVEKARQATFGDGLASDVIKAYSFVVMNYSPHDEIFCFGFSRGAYTARAVAGLITDIGIIKPQELDDFPELYRIYRKHNDNDSLRFRQSPEYRKWILGVEKPQVLKAGGSDDNWSQVPHDLPPEYTRVIQVVGVFDTVGALGIPYMSWTKQLSNEIARRYQWLGVEEYGFHNPSLSRYIKHAFHALALDDHKTAFTPTLWRLPANDQKLRPLAAARERLAEILRRRIDGTEDGSIQDAWKALIEREMDDQLGDTQPELKQVWFPGSHTNIGGGNPGILMGAPFDCEQLALVSFTWMCDQISPYVDLNDETIQANGNGPDSEILSTLADREIESRRKLVEFSKQLQGMTFNSVIQVVRLVLARFGFLNVGADNHEWALGPIIWGKASIKGGLIYDLLYALWFGLFLRFFLKNRTPGRYSKLSGHQNAAGTTNEEIHPAVRYRMIHDKKYKPGALKALQKPESKRGGVYTWERKWGRPGPSLPEYKIKSEDRISRALASRSKLGKAFIKGL